MPGLDRQGPPNGDGNQSGRKMGKCNPNNKNKEVTESEQIRGRRWRLCFRTNDETLENQEFSGFRRRKSRGQGFGRAAQQNGSQMGRQRRNQNS